MAEDALRLMLFCPQCFASEDSGSWNHPVVPGLCLNCGANGSSVLIPSWAIDSIRQQASWVGKRYYPNEEDLETSEELKDLRARVQRFPGRTAVMTDVPDRWEVRQQLPGGRAVTTWVEARLEEEALRKASLRYVPQEKL